MIGTNSPEADARPGPFRNPGQGLRYKSVEPGWNSRLDEIQAAILRVKLRHLPEWGRSRRKHASEYSKLLGGVCPSQTPKTHAVYEHVFHQYPIRRLRRDDFQQLFTNRKSRNPLYN